MKKICGVNIHTTRHDAKKLSRRVASRSFGRCELSRRRQSAGISNSLDNLSSTELYRNGDTIGVSVDCGRVQRLGVFVFKYRERFPISDFLSVAVLSPRGEFSSHRRRRRDATGQFCRVGSGGVSGVSIRDKSVMKASRLRFTSVRRGRARSDALVRWTRG